MAAKCIFCGFILTFSAYHTFGSHQISDTFDPNKKENKETSRRLRRHYHYSLLVFYLIFGGKALFNCLTKRNLKTRAESLLYLRIGCLTAAIFATIEYITLLFMYWNFWVGYPFFVVSHWLLIFICGWFLLEESYACVFYRSYRASYILLMFIASFVGMYRWIQTDSTDENVHTMYIGAIGILYIESFVLFKNPSEVFFLRRYLGKMVVCKINNEDGEGEVKGVLTKVGCSNVLTISNAVENINGETKCWESRSYLICQYDDIRDIGERENVAYNLPEARKLLNKN